MNRLRYQNLTIRITILREERETMNKLRNRI